MFLNCLCFCHTTYTSSSQKQYPTIIQELCRQFSLTDIRKSTNNFDENKLIARGAYSDVYKGCLQHNDGSYYAVAVKRLRVKISGVCEQFKNEVELLCQLRHPNIISLIGFCNHENEKILVHEYMANRSLYDQLQGGEREVLSWKKRLEICIGAARGLHYLHAGAKRTLIHPCIATKRILLDHNMEPKLTGFQLSIQEARFMSKPKPIRVDAIAGFIGYIATEYKRDLTVTDKCDIFSFGVVLLQLVCGPCGEYFRMGREFRDNLVEENIDGNIKGKVAPECWQVFTDIIVKCLQYEPDERPTMDEVEVELEQALLLQEQADITNTNCDYTLFSTTIFPPFIIRHSVILKIPRRLGKLKLRLVF